MGRLPAPQGEGPDGPAGEPSLERRSTRAAPAKPPSASPTGRPG
jgi:hypothetical protein